MKIKNWFLKNFVCPTIFSNGHIPVKEVRETKIAITQYKCERCDCTLGLGHWKELRMCYPPEYNEQEIKDWNKFYDEKEDSLRKGILWSNMLAV